MGVLSTATLSPALPAIEQAFADVPNVALLSRLTLTLPALLIALIAPFAGTLLDRWGRRPVMLLAIILYGFAGTSSVFATSLSAILWGRAILGIAIAAITSGFATLIGDFFSGRELKQFMGWAGGLNSFGAVVYLLIAGLLADIGWRYTFLIFLFGFIVLPLFYLFIPEPTLTTPEQQTHSAPVPWRKVGLIYLIGWVSFIFFYIVPVQIPFYLTDGGGTTVAIAISFLAFTAGLAGFLYPRIRQRFSFTRVYALAFLGMGLGYGLISLTNGLVIVSIGLVLGGLGVGLFVPNSQVWLTELTPAGLRGRIMGGLTASLFIGQFLSPIVVQPLVANYNLATLFAVASALQLIFAILFWLMSGSNFQKVRISI